MRVGSFPLTRRLVFPDQERFLVVEGPEGPLFFGDGSRQGLRGDWLPGGESVMSGGCPAEGLDRFLCWGCRFPSQLFLKTAFCSADQVVLESDNGFRASSVRFRPVTFEGLSFV